MSKHTLKTAPKTIFCDIDGTLVKHMPPQEASKPDAHMELLPGTIETLIDWDRKGYNIILTTGRRESLRTQTERQLSEVGIIYDKLIMGIGGGQRFLINDLKPTKEYNTAHAIVLERNQGIKDLEI